MQKSFALTGILLTIQTPHPAQAQDANANGAPIIDSITIVSRDVFDPSEAEKNLLFHLSNTLHIRTRRYVVDRELLFDVGDPYDSATVAETLRNLRAIRLFRDVAIDTAWVGDRLNVHVDAADAWTTTLQLDLKSSGGDTEWAIGIRERNLLGTATVVRAKHRNVGFGLRLGSIRAGGPTVGRIDLAYRFGSGFDGSRWAVSFGRGYSY